MATADVRITSYWVHLSSKLLVNSALGAHDAVPAQGMIQCLGAGGSLTIFFLDAARGNPSDDSDNWPNRCEVIGPRMVGEIFAPIAHYPMYLDVLRNEDPVIAHFDTAQPFLMRLSCTEPAGEGEYFTR